MNLYLLSAYKTHPCLDYMHKLQQLDTNRAVRLVTDPAEADAIVFVENTQFSDLQYKTLLAHPLIQQYPDKVFMYNEMDQAWPMLPGLYCSLTARLANSDAHIAFPYVNVQNSGIAEIYAKNTPRKWLYSFVGSASHPLRKKVMQLGGNNARIVDTSEFCTWDPAQTSKFAYQKLYTDTIAASKFVLCPRGIGPASLRLYETIEAGRIPVIISDSWVAPPQIDWSFAVRIPEFEINSIPEKLAAIEHEWQDRSAAARQAWESAYAPDQMFNTFGLAIKRIGTSDNVLESSLKSTLYKWRVVLEQEVRNIVRPSSSPNQQPALQSIPLLRRLFSR